MIAAALHPKEAARQNVIDQLQLTGPEMEESFDRLTRLIRYVMGVEIALFTVVDQDRQYFKSVQGMDVRQTPRNDAFCAHAILQEGAFVVTDATKDVRFADNPLVTGAPHIRFYAGLPVRTHSRLPVGTLCAIDTYPRQLMPEQLKLLEDLRDILEESLMLRSLSVRDHLTGLFNRRYFDEFLEREWRRGYRRALPLSTLKVDIDHFKTYNVAAGHPAGDQALRLIGHHLSAQLRRGGDVIARHGGATFVIVLPDTRANDAAGVAVHLRESIQKLGIANPASQDGVLTVSVGGATSQGREQYLLGHAALMDRADKALLQAKQAGRNRVQMV